eukprot:1190384-Prorocentrum_minimum.AAC.2
MVQVALLTFELAAGVASNPHLQELSYPSEPSGPGGSGLDFYQGLLHWAVSLVLMTCSWIGKCFPRQVDTIFRFYKIPVKHVYILFPGCRAERASDRDRVRTLRSYDPCPRGRSEGSHRFSFRRFRFSRGGGVIKRLDLP